jgi:hypothetical protein
MHIVDDADAVLQANILVCGPRIDPGAVHATEGIEASKALS